MIYEDVRHFIKAHELLLIKLSKVSTE